MKQTFVKERYKEKLNLKYFKLFSRIFVEYDYYKISCIFNFNFNFEFNKKDTKYIRLVYFYIVYISCVYIFAYLI